ncbi:tRNA (adenosine(37)-N6)-dimethylallyltransferase MiaA [Planktotalea frisia]|uniref:tRNA (adenosine(37)-N6)-dimethylallyltransferase MiaA n=1 Tax=Planktotalea frisia TaxID=696762 RepID=UPI003B5AE0AB
MSQIDISAIDRDLPVLIAGPTASGKSALALEIAQAQGGVIINADASQVFDGWRVLTARPDAADEARAEHILYGHVPFDSAYSAGKWLRDVAPLLNREGKRAIIVGGTGLYFLALTQGLADIPETTSEVRQQANSLRDSNKLAQMIAALDAKTSAKIDLQNPMRVQRAWEVQTQTGKGLAQWHDETPAPLVPLDHCTALVLDADTQWLNARIARRFDLMLEQGALDEARANLSRYDPELLSCKAIGAPELAAHLRGEITLDDAREAATIATRQFAKRQRTWFRARMKNWHSIKLP